MPTYDAEAFTPPAPVAFVTLQNIETNAVWQQVPMLLDTGADVTLVPASVIGQLVLSQSNNAHYELVGFDDSHSFAPVVQLAMLFAGRTFRGQFLLIEQPYGIIGRNILNALPVLLDGPQLTWDIVTR